MSRQFARRLAAALLLLALLTVSTPAAHASGSGSTNATGGLSKRYPLGTQTLCCERAAGTSHPRPAAGAGRSPRTPRTTGSATSTARATSGHHGNLATLLLIVIVAVVPLLMVLLALVGRRRSLAARRAASDAVVSPRAHRAGKPDGDDLEPMSVEFVDDRPIVHDEPIIAEVVAKVPQITAMPPNDASEPEPDGAAGDDETGEVAFELGVLLYERGHLDGAEAAWRRAVQHHHARAATRLGMALEHRGDPDGAANAYRNAERWGDAVGAERAAALDHRTG